MPELPEVEVTRRCIHGALHGAQVRAVQMGLPLRWPLGIAGQALEGALCGDMTRRGKYLWLPLSRPPASALPGLPRGVGEAAEGGLLIHLGMSGALSFGDGPAEPGPYDHFRLLTDRGCLWLTDPRRFGAVVWSASTEVDPARKLLAGLGPEPFDPALDEGVFHAALQARRAPVKTALLSGELVVGAGNIYACEALHLARIDPRTPSNRISRPRAARLLSAVRQVLKRAIEAGGTTLRDFSANGAAGHYQEQAQVYGRGGQPCNTCGSVVRRIVQGQRSTFFCGVCQKR
ncbi:MAG: bifunctional DNA-formamidopyrimidine glycosylase/DNA-(apurinic or apyrimidinic site) lyase [Betaproteobacteria bacterium]